MKALDTQVDLIRFWRGRHGPAVASYWVQMLAGGRGHQDGRRIDLGTPEQFAGREARCLDLADIYWVSPTMTDMIENQREKLPVYELRSTDIPSLRGFAYLAHPIYILDNHGRRCNVRAFSWETEVMIIAQDGTRPSPLTQQEAEEALALDARPIPEDQQVEEPDDDDYTLVTPVVPREDGSHLAKAVRIFVYSDRDDADDEGWGEDIEAIAEAKANVPCAWSLFHVETWMLNQRLPKAGDPDLKGSESFLRVLAALWTLCNQKIVITGGMGLDKHARRRAERAGCRPSEIKVVVLRREYEKNTWEDGERPEAGHGYSHAFWVRGHLRNQWYRSEGRHKPIWIEPFIKGEGPPEEKGTVYVVRR